MSTRPATSLALWGTLAATALAAGLVARRYGRWKNNRPPVKWRRVGELLELTLYPLKSGRGIDLEEADCAELGLRTTDKKPLVLRDRFFLAYNASSGEFVTARGHPKMVLIQVVPREDGDVTFLAPGMPELQVRLPTEGSAVEKRECTMWFNERVETVDCGEEAALWMSQYIQGRPGIRLGYHFIPVVPRRRVSVGAWAPFHAVYTSLTDHDTFTNNLSVIGPPCDFNAFSLESAALANFSNPLCRFGLL
uniref:Molybdenum cofactor sulfurase middle domain-containing protein n=1 Tax=Timema genevievae TaxID=629358 RepID=A0A7R9K2U6_TIMGE|nr:unnamed protein product [Timema genevievae]